MDSVYALAIGALTGIGAAVVLALLVWGATHGARTFISWFRFRRAWRRAYQDGTVARLLARRSGSTWRAMPLPDPSTRPPAPPETPTHAAPAVRYERNWPL